MGASWSISVTVVTRGCRGLGLIGGYGGLDLEASDLHAATAAWALTPAEREDDDPGEDTQDDDNNEEFHQREPLLVRVPLALHSVDGRDGMVLH